MTTATSSAADRGVEMMPAWVQNSYGSTASVNARDAGGHHRTDVPARRRPESGRAWDRAVRALRSLVDEGGTLVLSGGGSPARGGRRPDRPPHQGAALVAPARPRDRHPRGTSDREMLQELATLISAGALKPVIDHTYRFDEAPDANRHPETEHARAKVVVTVADQGDRS
jgi:hypothetical protein